MGDFFVRVILDCIAICLVKLAWWLTGMSEWTGLVEMPWSVAAFFVFVFSPTERALERSSK